MKLLRIAVSVGSVFRNLISQRSTRSLSELVNQITEMHLQGAGNSHQSVHRNRLCTALNGTDVHRMQFSFLRQFFLAQTHPFAMNADRMSKRMAVFGNGRHDPLQVQEAQ